MAAPNLSRSQALVGLFELPEDDSVPDDEHFVEIEDTPGYQSAYSQLAFAGKNEHDPVAAFPDPRYESSSELHTSDLRSDAINLSSHSFSG